MKFLIPISLWVAAQAAMAHDGHGDTFLHALAHFLEGDGLVVLLVILALGGVGLCRGLSQWSRNK